MKRLLLILSVLLVLWGNSLFQQLNFKPPVRNRQRTERDRRQCGRGNMGADETD